MNELMMKRHAAYRLELDILQGEREYWAFNFALARIGWMYEAL